MKKCIPYIIAALIGFFFSAVVCHIIGFDSYNYGVTDIIMAALACVIVWCWRGIDGIGADVERTLMSLKERTSRRSRR